MGDLDKGKSHGPCLEGEEYRDELDLARICRDCYLQVSFSRGMRGKNKGELGMRWRENWQDATQSHKANGDLQTLGQ